MNLLFNDSICVLFNVFLCWLGLGLKLQFSLMANCSTCSFASFCVWQWVITPHKVNNFKNIIEHFY
jgi:hypothetical protein